MRLNPASHLLGALALLLAFATPALAEAPLLKPTDRVGTLPVDTSPTVRRAINVMIDAVQLDGTSRRLTMVGFDHRNLVLLLDRIETIPGRGFTWYGRLAGDPSSSVIFTVVGGIVNGNIDTKAGKVYQIRYAGAGVYTLRDINRTQFPSEAPPRPTGGEPPAPTPPPAAPSGTACADSPLDIDVLVVYTPAARVASGGTDAMDGIIYLAIAEANQIYLDSAINQRLRLAHVQEVAYTESGSIQGDLDHLQNGSDGVIDDVQTLRNTFAADVVSLIMEYPASAGLSCGQGNVMAAGFLGPSFESLAYSVVRRDCAAGNFSLAHEIGHNMGAHHVVGNGAYTYSHAFARLFPSSSSVPAWRTVMADETAPLASARVGRFSNPNLNYPAVGGNATGIGGLADNHLTLNTTALTVANFRCASPGVDNVWMKDTWDDTGLEPDPGTAAEDLWKSPYIWARTTQDTAGVHQHEHQNPRVGAANWVYVKMHNGGSAAASGSLEIYWADASTALTWPGDWTLLSSVPVSAFAPHSTIIVEAPWNNLPGQGHYCLVARWNSAADPMATAEGADIGANVRANNNLIWRNLNIVDLVAGSSGKASTHVMNPDTQNRAIELVIRSAERRGKPSFLAAGQVVVEFDEALAKAWRKGGSRGTGFRKDGNRIMVGKAGATFENVVLPYRAGGRLTLTFRRLRDTPRVDYVVDVVQRRPAESPAARDRPLVVGGVSYEIHADRDFNAR